MTIKCLATGSRGNCYILTSKFGKKLIVDVGIKWETILYNIDNMNDVEGVIISHHHSDHNYKMGKLRVSDCLENSLIPTYYPGNCEIGKLYDLGDFKVIPLECVHNVECYGYLIMVDNKKILFATDTQIIPNINIICDYYMVEVNYDLDMLEETMQKMMTDSQEEIPRHIQSVYANHSALQTVEDYFEYHLKDKKVKGIFTIHASMSGFLNPIKVYERLSKYSDSIVVMEGGLEIEC